MKAIFIHKVIEPTEGMIFGNVMDIDTELNAFCTTKKLITRDTFIEAAFMVCSGNKALIQEIVEEAKKRYHQRKQGGEQRKFQTMAKKINT